jgi:hypothetical protein
LYQAILGALSKVRETFSVVKSGDFSQSGCKKSVDWSVFLIVSLLAFVAAAIAYANSGYFDSDNGFAFVEPLMGYIMLFAILLGGFLFLFTSEFQTRES